MKTNLIEALDALLLDVIKVAASYKWKSENLIQQMERIVAVRTAILQTKPMKVRLKGKKEVEETPPFIYIGDPPRGKKDLERTMTFEEIEKVHLEKLALEAIKEEEEKEQARRAVREMDGYPSGSKGLGKVMVGGAEERLERGESVIARALGESLGQWKSKLATQRAAIEGEEPEEWKSRAHKLWIGDE